MIWRIAILLACGAAASAQLPPPQAAAPPIEPSLERGRKRAPRDSAETPARLDAVAYDRQGQPIAGLQAADFSLSVNGAARKIESCEHKTGQPLRLAVIVDDLSLSAEHNNAARRDLRSLLERLKPGDEMAVLRASAGSGGLDHFTSDRRALETAIDRAAYNPAAADAPPETLAGTFRVAVRGVLEGMREIPGRKAVLVISERLRDARRRSQVATLGVAAIANAASASLYIVDMIGAPELTSLDLGLSQLVQDTGGVYFNGGTVAAALAQIERDQAAYYLLTFHPGEVAHDFFAAAPRVERLALTASRAPGLRTRNGLFGTSLDNNYSAGDLDLNPSHAVGRELVGDRLRARVTALAANDRSWQINGLVQIDANDLTFTRETDGKHRAEVDIIASLFSDNGMPDNRIARTVDIVMGEKAVRDARAWGFTYTITAPITRPGSYQLFIVARDCASGRLGTARSAVTASWGPAQLSMSSLVIHGDVTKDASGESVQDPNEGAVLRLFRPGRKVTYGYELFNVGSDNEKRSSLDVSARIWRDGALITEAAPVPLQFGASETPSHRGAAGTVALTPQTRPGTYVLGVTVHDKIANRTATRYMDFEVRP